MNHSEEFSEAELVPHDGGKSRRGSREVPDPPFPMPCSQQAEEHVVSLCLLDPEATMRLCEKQKLDVSSFHTGPMSAAFEALLYLWSRKVEIGLHTLVEEMRVRNTLDLAGGMENLLRVSSVVPTSAQAEHMVRTVRQYEIKRRLLTLSASAREMAVRPGVDLAESLEDFQESLKTLVHGATNKPRMTVRKATEYYSLPPDDPSVLVGADRWMCRGSTGLVVGSTSIGKTSWCYECASWWSAGRSFMELPPKRALRNLMIVGEDDRGELGDLRESITSAMTDEELALFDENMLIIEERILTGQDFFQEVGKVASEHRADVVWINPLLHYCGLDLTKPGEVSTKLRPMIAKSNPDEKWATILVHHTNKPPPKSDKVSQWNELIYNMTGSADLANMPRFGIYLQPTEVKGEFYIHFTKRGDKLNLMRTVQSESGQMRHELQRNFWCGWTGGSLTAKAGHKVGRYTWRWDRSKVLELAKPDKADVKRVQVEWGEFREALTSVAYGAKKSKPVQVLQRVTNGIREMKTNELADLFSMWVDEGLMGRALGGYYVMERPGEKPAPAPAPAPAPPETSSMF